MTYNSYPRTCNPDEGRPEQSERAKYSHLRLNLNYYSDFGNILDSMKPILCDFSFVEMTSLRVDFLCKLIASWRNYFLFCNKHSVVLSFHKPLPQTCHPDEGRPEQSERAKYSHLRLNIISRKFNFHTNLIWLRIKNRKIIILTKEDRGISNVRSNRICD